MFKSLILSALLSFGTASYEFDCSEILQTRTAPVENIDYSRVLGFTIDNSESSSVLYFQAINLNYVSLSETIQIGGFSNDSYFNTRIWGSVPGESPEGVHNLMFSPNSQGYLSIVFSSNDTFPEIYVYPDSSQSRNDGNIYLESNMSLTIDTETIRVGTTYFSLAEVQELAQIFSYYVTSYELEPVPVPSLSLIEEIGQVLMWVPGQFVTLFSTLTSVFYSNGALTLPGLMLVIGLGVFICALILDFILKFRRI